MRKSTAEKNLDLMLSRKNGGMLKLLEGINTKQGLPFRLLFIYNVSSGRIEPFCSYGSIYGSLMKMRKPENYTVGGFYLSRFEDDYDIDSVVVVRNVREIPGTAVVVESAKLYKKEKGSPTEVKVRREIEI
ncbi:hypothetical protein GF371_01680 [Candidatus Woesearchaeota archaeon]|nr:hypothetical protein [Candidatus Woesearchaeota archaeon]